MLSGSILFFFFFQAEDGIRDVAVTGVQTCALPISPAGVGIFTFAITRSTNPNSGANRVSSASSRSSLRSRSAVCRHSAHCARWTSRAAGRRPCAQSSASSGVRCGASGVGFILAQPYAVAGAPVSLLAVLEVAPQFIAPPMDIRLHRAERQVQDVGDLLVAVPLHVAQ